jgi:hypothetical protein
LGAATFTGTSGTRSAQATFDLCNAGTQLCINLSNISLFDVLDPTEVLTGFFWEYDGDDLSGLTKIEAKISAGGSVVHGGTDPGGVVGGEWAFVPGLIGFPGAYAIGSAGYIPGTGYQFPGSNLQGPASIDGLQYGIVPLADNLASGNAPVTGGNALIVGGVNFVLGNLPVDFDLSKIRVIQFQYGTSLTEPNIPVEDEPVPEPTTVGLMGAGLLFLISRRGRN